MSVPTKTLIRTVCALQAQRWTRSCKEDISQICTKLQVATSVWHELGDTAYESRLETGHPKQYLCSFLQSIGHIERQYFNFHSTQKWEK